MALQFVYGASGYGKSQYVNTILLQEAKNNPHRNFLIIVPDQFTMETQKELCKLSSVGGIMNIDVLSFKRLAYRILEEVGGIFIPVLDDTGKSLILQRLASRLEEQLPVIGGNIKKAGYIHEVKSAISEFMQYGFSPRDLDGLIHSAEGKQALALKLRDLQTMYGEFLSFTKERYITTEEELTYVEKQLEHSEKIKDAVLVFDGFTGFTPVQASLCQQLLRYTRELIVTVLFDSQRNLGKAVSEADLFYLSQKMVDKLTRLAKEVNVPIREDIVLRENQRTSKAELLFLEKNIFRYNQVVYPNEVGSISIWEAKSPLDEMQNVCEEICRVILSKQYRYKDIAVVTGDLPGYAHIVEECFAKFKLPCFLDTTRGILLNPFIEYLKSAMEIVAKGYTYDTVFHFLRSGMVSIPREDIDALENYVLALGIRGKGKWNAPFYHTCKEFGKNWQNKLEQINKTRKLVIEQFAIFDKKAKTVQEKILLCYEFLTMSRVEEKLEERAEFFEKEGKLEKASEYRQIYRLVMKLFEQMVELLGEERISWKDFEDILIAGFDEMQVGTIPQNVDAIVVGDMKRTRLKDVRILFFVGVNDGIIPTPGGTGGILSDIDREFLASASIELAPTPRQQMYEQRLYLYMNMTKPTDRLIISYAKVSSEGSSLRPSYLVGMLSDLFPTCEKKKVVSEIDDYTFVEEAIVAEVNGWQILIQFVREYAQNGNPKLLDKITTLYGFFNANKETTFSNEKERTDITKQELLAKILQAAFYQYNNTGIAKEIASALYGKVLENSVSRLEKYAACAYAHFLTYGLSLQEREEYALENKDTGNILHGVLEDFSRQLEETEYTWFDVPEEVSERIIESSLEQYAKNYGQDIIYDSARNTYMLTRLKRVLKRSVKTLQYQLNKGLFTPTDFEVSFSMHKDMDTISIQLSEEEKMVLKGRIDRVDTYEDDTHVYVKVMDYKSGNKKFDLVALYYGLSLQLVMYLNMAVEREKMRHSAKEIVPAGMFYYHVADPMISAEGELLTEAQIDERIRKELRMEGVASGEEPCIQALDASKEASSDVFKLGYKKDGELTASSAILPAQQMDVLSTYVNQKIQKMGKEIVEGCISVNPYEMGAEKACTYCNFRSVCRIDPKIDGFEERLLDRISTEDVLARMQEEI